MGVRNFLIEGVSGTGKTSVCRELQRRGHHAINGDTELAYQGDPLSGVPTETASHEHHIWDVQKVMALAADQRHEATYFCGGSRNFSQFLQLFDKVFVLEIDSATLDHRLNARPEDEFGGKPAEREFIARLHQSREDLPQSGIIVDATAPLTKVVDEILRQSLD